MLQISLDKVGSTEQDRRRLARLLCDEFGDCPEFGCTATPAVYCMFHLDPNADENEGWDLQELIDVWVVCHGMKLTIIGEPQ